MEPFTLGNFEYQKHTLGWAYSLSLNSTVAHDHVENGLSFNDATEESKSDSAATQLIETIPELGFHNVQNLNYKENIL